MPELPQWQRDAQGNDVPYTPPAELHYRNEARDMHRRCETLRREWGDDEDRDSACRHDLGRGVLVSEILGDEDDDSHRTIMDQIIAERIAVRERRHQHHHGDEPQGGDRAEGSSEA